MIATCPICWSSDCTVIDTGSDVHEHRREIELAKRHQREGLSISQVRSLCEVEREHQLDAARAFGAARGWKLSPRPFSVETLAQRKCSGSDDGLLPRGGFWDHPYFYRVGRRAAAVAAHLYDGEQLRNGVAWFWAARVGLVASFPPEPSWWFYPHTTLVLYEPAPVWSAEIVELAEARR